MKSTIRLQRPLVGAAALVLAMACASAFGQGQQQAQPIDPEQNGSGPAPGSVSNEDLVTLNFVNADIQAVIKAVGEMTGRNFLIDPRVQGTVNIVAPRAVPRGLVFPIMLSALRVQGFAAVGGDLGFVNIVPESDAKFYAGTRDPRRARGDQIVTEVFQLRHEQAAQVVPILRPLIAPNNVINAFPASNTVVVTDYAANLERVRKVLATIDQPQPSELVTVTMRYAAAVDVGQAVQRLMPESTQAGQPGAAPRVSLTIDPRTNSLLVRAENPVLTKRIRELAARMDIPTAAGSNIHVVYLKNAEAAKLAESLRGILTGQAPAAPSAPRPSLSGGSATAGGAAPGPGAAPPPPAPLPTAAPAGGGGAGGGNSGGGSVGSLAAASIQAYPETNSLVIIAPDAVYQQLRTVIDKLDARRAQVYVEALIVEMTANRAAEFGIQWQALSSGDTNATRILGGTNFIASDNQSTILSAAASGLTQVPPGLNLGVVRGTITIGGQEIFNLAALLRALETDSTTNILSTPNLLTLDNEEARIQVGQNVPIITGSFNVNANAGGATQNPFQTFERRDVGVTLRIRPQIAEGGTVKLQLFQEVSSVDSNNPAAGGIILNKRSLESSVLVDDGQIIVLGGLISDDVQTSKQEVPVLGQIPVLGALFRYDIRRRAKTNLMVFLRPVVLRDATTTAALTGDRYDAIRGFQAEQQAPDRFPLPSMRGPLLPEQLPPLVPNRPAPPQGPAASATVPLPTRQ